MTHSHNGIKPHFSSYVLLILLSMIWGTSFILMKQGLKAFSPDIVAALRVSVASLLLLPIAVVKLKELRLHHYAKLFISGMIAIFIPAFLFATAQTHLNSAVTGILNSLTPIFTVLVSAWFFKQRFLRASYLGIGIGLIGSIVLIMADSGGMSGGVNFYSFLVALACILYSLNVNYVKFVLPDIKPLTITAVSLMMIGPLAWTYLFGFSGFITAMETNPEAMRSFGFIVLLGFMSTAIATILFNYLVKTTSPMFTSLVTYIMPFVSIGWGLLDGEHLFVLHYVGMGTIILGVYLAGLRR